MYEQYSCEICKWYYNDICQHDDFRKRVGDYCYGIKKCISREKKYKPPCKDCKHCQIEQLYGGHICTNKGEWVSESDTCEKWEVKE